MRSVLRLFSLLVLLQLLAACQPPNYSSAHPDSRNSGPFWEREKQQD